MTLLTNDPAQMCEYLCIGLDYPDNWGHTLTLRRRLVCLAKLTLARGGEFHDDGDAYRAACVHNLYEQAMYLAAKMEHENA